LHRNGASVTLLNMYGLSEIRRANKLADAKARKFAQEQAAAAIARPGGDASAVGADAVAHQEAQARRETHALGLPDAPTDMTCPFRDPRGPKALDTGLRPSARTGGAH